jgi:hypothetical protein
MLRATVLACAVLATPPGNHEASRQLDLNLGSAEEGRGRSQTVPVAVAAKNRKGLRFLEPESGTTFFSVEGDGTLRFFERVLGTLGSDLTFTFAGTGGMVTASVTDSGRVVIATTKGVDLGRLPENLSRLLREQGGRVESPYSIQADGSATAPRVKPLSFDAQGHLSERGLLVEGLTPENRRAAMFVYLVMTFIIPA